MIKLRALWALLRSETFLLYTPKTTVGKCPDGDTTSLIAQQINTLREKQNV